MREVVLESKIATPTLGEHLNQALSRPERQERSGSVTEAPMLAQSPGKRVSRSEFVARAHRA